MCCKPECDFSPDLLAAASSQSAFATNKSDDTNYRNIYIYALMFSSGKCGEKCQLIKLTEDMTVFDYTVYVARTIRSRPRLKREIFELILY